MMYEISERRDIERKERWKNMRENGEIIDVIN